MQGILIQSINGQELEAIISNAVAAAMEKYQKSIPDRPPIQSVDKLLSKKEAARYLGISLPTLSKYINDGYVKAHTVAGTRMRFKLSDLDKALRGLRSR
jgi:excisionase family DNA binding protein